MAYRGDRAGLGVEIGAIRASRLPHALPPSPPSFTPPMHPTLCLPPYASPPCLPPHLVPFFPSIALGQSLARGEPSENGGGSARLISTPSGVWDVGVGCGCGYEVLTRVLTRWRVPVQPGCAIRMRSGWGGVEWVVREQRHRTRWVVPVQPG